MTIDACSTGCAWTLIIGAAVAGAAATWITLRALYRRAERRIKDRPQA